MTPKFLLLIMITINTMAAVPTVEGLLRHPANSEVTSTNTILRLSLKDLSDEPSLSDRNSLYVKYFFNNELKAKIRLLQVVYNDKSMSNESIVNVKYIDNIRSSQLSREKRMFYAILSSLLLNRSTELSYYIKELSKDYKSNNQSVNYTKRNVILSYKKYLTDKKENKDLDESNNPFQGKDSDKRQQIKDVMSESYYAKSDAIKLEKVDGDFMWLVTLEHFKGFFLNELLRMKKLEFDNLSGLDVVSMDQYLLFDGIHEFPKKIKLNLNGPRYEFSTINLRHIESKNKSITSRYSDYKKKMNESKVLDVSMAHPLL
jgi:hypothetical protein